MTFWQLYLKNSVTHVWSPPVGIRVKREEIIKCYYIISHLRFITFDITYICPVIFISRLRHYVSFYIYNFIHYFRASFFLVRPHCLLSFLPFRCYVLSTFCPIQRFFCWPFAHSTFCPSTFLLWHLAMNSLYCCSCKHQRVKMLLFFL